MNDLNSQPINRESSLTTEYDEKDTNTLLALYEENLRPMEESEVVEGTILDIRDHVVVVNIGYKADGLIPVNEFRDLPDLQIGDKTDVYIEAKENYKGQLVLSRKQAKVVKAWKAIQNAFDSGEAIEGLITNRTKGGLMMTIQGLSAFLPGSQVDSKPVADFDTLVGKSMDVVVIKINPANTNIIVSHKALIEKSVDAQQGIMISQLEKGQILEGVVKNTTHFGAFIDLGGMDGLLHITDITWERITHPDEVLAAGQKVKVVILDFEEEKRRISLGMKQLTPHPWDSLPDFLEEGKKIKGKIANIAEYGAFVEVAPGVEGLIHISEMTWSQHVRNAKELFKVGDEVEAVILSLDQEGRKLALGTKQLMEDPWKQPGLAARYSVGTKHMGTVRNMAHFGVFVELEEGIDGLLHISDLHWTRKVSHPSEVVQTGQKVEVLVLEIDQVAHRLSLGLKQLQANPWETYEADLQPGSIHKGTVKKLLERGAIISFSNGLEGFAAKQSLLNREGQSLKVGEVVDFKVLIYNKDEKQLTLSHTATFSEGAISQKESHATHTSSNSKRAPKDTLGDLEALSNLKKNLQKSAIDKQD